MYAKDVQLDAIMQQGQKALAEMDRLSQLATALAAEMRRLVQESKDKDSALPAPQPPEGPPLCTT